MMNIGGNPYDNPEQAQDGMSTATPGYLPQQGDTGKVNFPISNDPYLSAIPGIMQHYYAPYQQMWQDPSSIMNRLGSGYQASPGYQFQLGQAMKSIGQSAAAGGMAGSPQQQQQSAQMATGMASQDFNKYLQNMLGMYMGGVQGYSQLGQQLGSNLLSESQFQQMQEQEKERQEAQKHQDLWGGIGAALGGGAAILGAL